MLQRRGPDDYQLLTRLEDDDPTFAPLKAPRDMNEFRTGLASVPTFAAWLAPTTGRHLPATLLHDILILRPDEPQQHTASPPGTGADHIYRETMKELGVQLVRRWMIWAAVSLRALGPKLAPMADRAGSCGSASLWFSR